MRAHLGDDFPLMADANMRWTVDQSIAAARAFRDSNLTWLEEPTIPDDIAGHARIVREGGVPIATGENLHTLHEFTQMIAAGGVTFPEPDVTNCGGITVFMKVAHLAEAFNLPLTSHGAHDLTVHLLAAVPNRSYLEVHGFGLDRYIAQPIVITEGNAQAPGPARPRRRFRLGGAGKDAGTVRGNDHGTALCRDMDRRAGAGRGRGVQQHHAADERAAEPGRRGAAGAAVERAWQQALADRRGASRFACRRSGDRSGNRSRAELRRVAGRVIPTGSLLISDPVELAAPALADIAITLHLPDDLQPSFGITGRYARLTNYISPLGNFAAEQVMPVGKITDNWYICQRRRRAGRPRYRCGRCARRFTDRRQHFDP